jgi:hypothetical protein
MLSCLSCASAPLQAKAANKVTMLERDIGCVIFGPLMEEF